MNKNDFIYLKHILSAITRIEEYIHAISYEDFMNNYKDIPDLKGKVANII